jgi:hypothetical protein
MLTESYSPAAAGVRGVFLVLKATIPFDDISLKLSQLLKKKHPVRVH